MSATTRYSRYIGLFDRGYGREAIEIGLEYPFHMSGVIPPPTFTVSIDTGRRGTPQYIQVVCVAANSQQEAASNLGIKQQDVSVCLARHRAVQKRLGRYHPSSRDVPPEE